MVAETKKGPDCFVYIAIKIVVTVEAETIVMCVETSDEEGDGASISLTCDNPPRSSSPGFVVGDAVDSEAYG